MKTQLKMTVLATAVTGLMSGAAFAGGSHGNGDDKNDCDYECMIGLAMATVNNAQELSANDVVSHGVGNSAQVDGVAQGAEGNLGMNVASGSLNVQDNAAALAAADAESVFGYSVSMVQVGQSSTGNSFTSNNVQNNAGIGEGAFAGASGNIGVNVAAGTGNSQKNSLAATTGPGDVTVALASSEQLAQCNTIRDEGKHGKHFAYNTNVSSLDDGAFNGASGNIGVNLAAGNGNLQSNSLSMAVSCNTCP